MDKETYEALKHLLDCLRYDDKFGGGLSPIQQAEVKQVAVWISGVANLYE